MRAAAEVVDGLANYLARGGMVADGQTMHLERYDSTIAFFSTPEQRGVPDALEICDINPATGLSGEGIPHLLSRLVDRA